MAKRIVTVYLEDDVLDKIDKLKDDEKIKDELKKRKLSRNDVIEFVVRFYWDHRTAKGILELD